MSPDPEPLSREGNGWRVLAMDNHLLACAKEAGLPVVPDESGDRSLLDEAREWVRVTFAKPGNVYLGVVHRLDRPVSGVVVLARTSKAAARLTAAFREGHVEKTYVAVMEGPPTEPEGRLEQWLLKDPARNVSRVVSEGTPGAKLAVTRWRLLAAGTRSDPACAVELVPETGRSHQLRIAARTLGHPLVGDLKYGAARALPDKSVALHARSLELPHPTRAERVRFEAPPPGTAVWRRLPAG